jgi:hypothetical protein
VGGNEWPATGRSGVAQPRVRSRRPRVALDPLQHRRLMPVGDAGRSCWRGPRGRRPHEALQRGDDRRHFLGAGPGCDPLSCRTSFNHPLILANCSVIRRPKRRAGCRRGGRSRPHAGSVTRNARSRRPSQPISRSVKHACRRTSVYRSISRRASVSPMTRTPPGAARARPPPAPSRATSIPCGFLPERRLSADWSLPGY